MAFDADEEILQDFLVEAGEILEKLSEQLVDLEQHPDDSDLLNAIFRGFHTVKGGAGFLQLEALVNCCHSAENVFDILRNHKRKVDSELMDVVLEALDNVNAMFEQVRNHEELTPAPDELIARLDALAQPEGEGHPPLLLNLSMKRTNRQKTVVISPTTNSNSFWMPWRTKNPKARHQLQAPERLRVTRRVPETTRLPTTNSRRCWTSYTEKGSLPEHLRARKRLSAKKKSRPPRQRAVPAMT